MDEAKSDSGIDRRTLLITGSAATALAAWLGTAGTALAQDKLPTWEETFKKITGDAKPVEGKVNVDMPEIAENGNTVPFTIKIDNPMTDANYVKALHVISTGNPNPGVATFKFSPSSGVATVSSRMRLGRTQDVVAVAELSNGSFLMGKRTVKVTIGGCGG
jgi:sulfur-oxidizing protein SoxY